MGLKSEIMRKDPANARGGGSHGALPLDRELQALY